MIDALRRELIEETGLATKQVLGLAYIDVGCGNGSFARRLAARGLARRRSDLDPSAIAFARAARSPWSWLDRLRCADITELELSAAHYDVVTCVAALHHVPLETVTRLAAVLPTARRGFAGPGFGPCPSAGAATAAGVFAPPVNLLTRPMLRSGSAAMADPIPPCVFGCLTLKCLSRRCSAGQTCYYRAVSSGRCCLGVILDYRPRRGAQSGRDIRFTACSTTMSQFQRAEARSG
jgi:SAM-dependent methyltransferase